MIAMKAQPLDPEWDPSEMESDWDAPCRIYGDDSGEIFALVDRIDYQWLSQWKWSPKFSRGGRKFYLRRNVQVGPRKFRTQKTLFLHTAVIQRMGLKRPSPEHSLCEHKDGDSLNCTRDNLCWVTPSQNSRSAIRRKGYYHLNLG